MVKIKKITINAPPETISFQEATERDVIPSIKSHEYSPGADARFWSIFGFRGIATEQYSNPVVIECVKTIQLQEKTIVVFMTESFQTM